jgi:hypothetical protein
VDDDRDGALDEDGPDDVDDDGMILEMLVERPDGAWALSADQRWAEPASPGGGRRFARVLEGRDDDGDGRFNEDGLGGVDLDRNFPVGRSGPWEDPSVGALPLSEPVARALAELARSRRCFAVLLLQGQHGGLAFPGGVAALETWAQPDHALYTQLGERFASATSRSSGALSLRRARGADSSGAALDWFAASCGALALELSPWGPSVDAPESKQAQPAGAELRARAPREPFARSLAQEQAWAAWLDEQRRGIGYVPWHPVELGNGLSAYVGGFEPWTVQMPPADRLPRALEGLPQFVRELAASAPRLEFSSVSLTRNAGVLKVRASLRNLGKLPTGLRASSASSHAQPLDLHLELGADARLLAGPPTVRFAPLAGGELSREVEWIVLAPQPAVLKLSAQGGWCAPLEREVRE